MNVKDILYFTHRIFEHCEIENITVKYRDVIVQDRITFNIGIRLDRDIVYIDIYTECNIYLDPSTLDSMADILATLSTKGLRFSKPLSMAFLAKEYLKYEKERH